jgi:hypothetical protein
MLDTIISDWLELSVRNSISPAVPIVTHRTEVQGNRYHLPRLERQGHVFVGRLRRLDQGTLAVRLLGDDGA